MKKISAKPRMKLILLSAAVILTGLIIAIISLYINKSSSRIQGASGTGVSTVTQKPVVVVPVPEKDSQPITKDEAAQKEQSHMNPSNLKLHRASRKDNMI